MRQLRGLVLKALSRSGRSKITPTKREATMRNSPVALQPLFSPTRPTAGEGSELHGGPAKLTNRTQKGSGLTGAELDRTV